MIGQKLDSLENNLNKKSILLKKMAEVLDKQLQLFDSSELMPEELDFSIEEQDNLVKELELLNEEADGLYEYLKDIDEASKEENASKITKIQKLLLQVKKDYDILQEKEAHCKQKMESFFRKERKSFGAGRRSSKAALDYYKNMSGSTVIAPQFMDRKK